jgi:hypothetical protein
VLTSQSEETRFENLKQLIKNKGCLEFSDTLKLNKVYFNESNLNRLTKLVVRFL